MKRLIWVCSIAALALTSCSNTSSRNVESSSKAAVVEKTPVAAPVKPRQYGIEVVKEYPHDEMSYTQGLFFQGERMVETTGQFGESTLRLVEPATGKALKRFDFDRKYFVEGSVELDGNIYVLTWKNRVAFIFDAGTLEYKQTYSYPRDGWGLTTDGSNLIASDGSSKLFWMDGSFKLIKTIEVRMNGKPLRNINELEWVDGKIWANVYLTDMIVIIDPATGNVEGVVDCTGLLPDSLRDEYTDVLNGIAVNPSDGRIYVTGKYWKRLYEIRIKEKE
ncbi:MAG: glutaminyl-peptide cyclotransferase [Bacteroidales bacterium]|nr:glutaminyl-peptide cyclotransferase [Bacteroidales bacterium]